MLNKQDMQTAYSICKELAAYIEETEPYAPYEAKWMRAAANTLLEFIENDEFILGSTL